MTSRTSVTSVGGLSLYLIVRRTEEPFGPRNLAVTSPRPRPAVGWPSMAVTTAPDWIPARAAGLSSTGETTFTSPFSIPMVRPTPVKAPLRDWVNAAYSLGDM